jgi:hypothetical protein
MRQQNPNGPDGPTPEDLAAYVDGELDAAARRAVEGWLIGHPYAADEVAGQRRLLHLWEATAPEEPAGPRWAPVLANVRNAVGRSKPARRWPWLVGALIGTAAAVWGALLLLPPQRPGERRAHPVPVAAPVEPWPVVSSDDVDIVSLHAADRAVLVVGVPPLEGGLELASADDVEMDSEPADAGMVVVQGKSEPPQPMLVTPVELEATPVH